MRIISSAWTIVIVAVSLSLALLSFFAFHIFLPTLHKTQYASQLADALEQQANLMGQPTKRNTAKWRVATAEQMVDQSSKAWDVYRDTHTPLPSVEAGGIDIGVDPYKLVTDTVTFRNSVQKEVNAQVVKGGVQLIGSAPTVPIPQDFNNTGTLLADYYNFPTFKFPIVIFNLGTITVRGTYDHIMDNVRAYRYMPHFLAVADGLRLDGTSPNLIGTYQLSIAGFVRGNKIWGALPEEAASGGAGSTFGGGAPPGFGGGGRGPGLGGMAPGLGGGPGFGAPSGAGPPPGFAGGMGRGGGK